MSNRDSHIENKPFKPFVPDPPKPEEAFPVVPKPEPAVNLGSTLPEAVIERSAEAGDQSPQMGNQPSVNRRNETVSQADNADREGDRFHQAEAAKAALDKATSYTAYQAPSQPAPEDLGAELAAIHQALSAFAAKIKNRNHPGDVPVVVALAEAHARIEAAKASIQGA